MGRIGCSIHRSTTEDGSRQQTSGSWCRCPIRHASHLDLPRTAFSVRLAASTIRSVHDAPRLWPRRGGQGRRRRERVDSRRSGRWRGTPPSAACWQPGGRPPPSSRPRRGRPSNGGASGRPPRAASWVRRCSGSRGPPWPPRSQRPRSLGSRHLPRSSAPRRRWLPRSGRRPPPRRQSGRVRGRRSLPSLLGSLKPTRPWPRAAPTSPASWRRMRHVPRFRRPAGATDPPAAAVVQARDGAHRRFQDRARPTRPQLCSGERNGVLGEPQSRHATIPPAASPSRRPRPGAHRHLDPIVPLSSALDAEEGAAAVRAPRNRTFKRPTRSTRFSAPHFFRLRSALEEKPTAPHWPLLLLSNASSCLLRQHGTTWIRAPGSRQRRLTLLRPKNKKAPLR